MLNIKLVFVSNEIVSEFVGDLKELWNMGGMAGGRSKFFVVGVI